MVAVARLALAVLALALGGAAGAQTHAPLERAVKAAFVYKFLAYVDWPAHAFESPTSPLTIGVVGADSIAADLAQAVADRTVAERAIRVRRLKEGESPVGMHVLFVGRSEASRLPSLARALQGQPTLLVTEWPGALDAGSTINLIIAADGRVRFEVAVDAAERAGLRVSSRMLALAQSVRPGGQ